MKVGEVAECSSGLQTIEILMPLTCGMRRFSRLAIAVWIGHSVCSITVEAVACKATIGCTPLFTTEEGRRTGSAVFHSSILELDVTEVGRTGPPDKVNNHTHLCSRGL